jgi:hypothetical protein
MCPIGKFWSKSQIMCGGENQRFRDSIPAGCVFDLLKVRHASGGVEKIVRFPAYSVASY